MAFDAQRAAQRHIYWFIIDGTLSYDRQGWEFWLRTPLFGFDITYCFPDLWHVEEVRINRIYLGLLARWPTFSGDKMYRLEWEKKWQPRSATQTTL